MRGGPLSDPDVLEQLQPYVTTWWHSGAETEMPPDVREVFAKSGLNPSRLNVFALLLDPEGRVAHSFYGLPAAAYKSELAKGSAKLHLRDQGREPGRAVVLPDLKSATPGALSGVHLFVRHKNMKPVVEVVPTKAEQWRALSYPGQTREVDANILRDWLVQLYPPGISPKDERKPFKEIAGSLTLVPAGADEQGRYALLRGNIRLAKGSDPEPAFAGTLEAVVTYRRDSSGARLFCLG